MLRRALALSAVLMIGVGGCVDAENVLEPAAEASFSRNGLPNGAKWSETPTLTFNEDYAYIDFALTGLGNARDKSITIEGEVHAQVRVTCEKRRGNNRRDFERTQGINGSGDFPIDRNGRVVGPLQIYRGNGNGQAIEFCKGQNFDTGSVTLIRSLGQGSWVRVVGYESVIPTHYF